jgi:GT2 family glycosyltransferase
MKHSVAIIVLNWNGKVDTLECLSSLQRIDQGDNDVSIIVVDNGSRDGSVEAIKKRYPSVTLLENTKNLGFCAGNNQGIQYALNNGCDFFWILNNDTTVDKHALTSLLKGFEREKVGITVSKIYFSSGREFHHDRYKDRDRGKVIWYAGGIIDWANIYGTHRGVDQVDCGQYDKEEMTQFATGCSMMISRKCLDAIGVFDERYFAYLEDLDLSVRALQNGFSILYVPASMLWHNNAGSTARPGNALQRYYITRNRLLFGLKYASVRTKFALVRETFRLALFGSEAERKAIIDAALGKYGKQYEWNT